MPAVATKVDVPVTEDSVGTSTGKMIDGKWEGKYNIFDPTKVKYAERTEFLRGLCGHIDQQDTLEDIFSQYPANGGPSNPKDQEARFDLMELGQMYVKYKNKGARLPKFSRWVTGMFAGNASMQKMLAEEGQRAARRKIIMSVDLIDILRCADTPHFHSCFAKNNGYSEEYARIPVRIAEECPGIGIVYVDDENGKMMGRLWMHHAKIVDTDEDVIVLPQSQYGCLTGRNLARLLHDNGIKVAVGSYYGDAADGFEKVKVKYVGCFTKTVHHDLVTWGNNTHTVSLVKPIFINEKKGK
jgi:hypothetical protein